MRVRVFAPAKINLTLHVGRPGADGRHPIASIAAFADVGDYVWAEDADRPNLALAGPFAAALANERDNLVVRAAQMIAAEAGVQRGVKLTLDKQLPIASGIGGGSADAAATLRALDALWSLKLSLRDLEKLAARIGADGPACVSSTPCLMSGGGEKLAALPYWPDLDAVLINPGQAAATAAVYRRFDELGLGDDFAPERAPGAANVNDAIALIAQGRNDLTAPARDVAPAIEDVFAFLQSCAEVRVARLSGSGASVFALVESRAAGRAIVDRAAEAHPFWWARSVRLARIDVAAKRV